MASDADTPELTAVYNRLLERHRNLSLVVPFFYGLATPPGEEETPQLQNTLHLQGSNPGFSSSSGQRARDLDAVIRDFLLDTTRNGGGGFRGLPPASRASIEAMPSVEIDAADCGIGECVICLVEWSQGEVVKEMPCKHRFHGGCVEKWLGVHWSCPVCRFQMPAEPELEKKMSDEEEGRRRVGRDLFASFSFGELNADQPATSIDSSASGSSANAADSEIRD